MTKKSAARSGFADEIGARRNHGAYQIPASMIRADHRENINRAALYSLREELPELAEHPAFDGVDKFCFSRREVLERVESFIASDQETRIKVHRTSTGLAFCARGYLRHVAALWIEVERPDDLGSIKVPGGGSMKDGIGVDVEPEPSTEEARVAAALSNITENTALIPTPIDEAIAASRLLDLGIDAVEVSDRLGLANRSAKPESKKAAVRRAKALLTLPLAMQRDIRDGTITADEARRRASKDGRGSFRGPRPSIKHTTIRERLGSDAKPPTRGLSAAGVRRLLSVIAGDTPAKDLDEDSTEREYADWLVGS